MPDNTTVIGGYLPLNSFLHGLDARTKTFSFLVFLYCVMVSDQTAVTLFNLLIILSLACLSQAPFIIWAKHIGRFAPMLVITFGLNLVFTAPGFYYEVFGVTLPIGVDSLRYSLLLTVKLTCAIVLALILTFSTTPSQFTRSIQWFATPLGMLRIPVGDFSLVIFMAMRFVPLFQQELHIIREAQISRGMDFDSGNILLRGKRLLGLLRPAFTMTAKRSEVLAHAMSARGFVPGAKRTLFRQQTFSARDISALIILTLYIASWHVLSSLRPIS